MHGFASHHPEYQNLLSFFCEILLQEPSEQSEYNELTVSYILVTFVIFSYYEQLPAFTESPTASATVI
jgi:hypothetical protein